MRKIFAVLAFAAVLMSGCTVFQDDVYKLQAGYYGSDAFDRTEDAIYEEFKSRFGEGRVFRADIEWKYDHWTAISDVRAVGLDKFRMRISAYPQLETDGHYEAVVIARQEVYTGSSMGRGGPTAMYSSKWTEAGRDVGLEAELANGINARLRNGNAGGN